MSDLKIYKVIRKGMGNGKWKSYSVQRLVLRETGRLYSESTITRRLREMGAVATRPTDGSTAWDYRLTTKKVK